MSLIHDIKQLQKSCADMEQKAAKQQAIYHFIISGVVALHQRYRSEKQYQISDELRHLVNSVGVVIIQGTGGYKYPDIPKALIGRQVDDTWVIK